jgi:muconate cycloisomerase
VIGVVDIVPPSQAEEMARELASHGHTVIKVKIGLDARQDLLRVEAVRKAVGDGVRIRVDGNQGYDRATSIWVFSRMEPLGLEWIEQPVPHWDLEGLQALCQRLDTPVAVDESVHTPEDAMRVIRAGAADVVNIKVTKCGGIDRSQKIAAICAAAGLPCYVGGCIETHPGVAASAHFYAATPNIVSAAEIRGESAYVDDVVVEPLQEVKGEIQLPEGPGLGVMVDEEKVARYRADL